jgi:acyl-CoA thioester hydrolase
MISAQVVLTAQFGELDPMQVVWHGNYIRYFEHARAALMDKIDYNFPGLDASGYLWPIVDMRVKYIRPVRFRQTIQVEATLVEYENRIRVDYVCRDKASGEILTKAHTIQVAVHAETGEMSFESPPALIAKVRASL